MFLSSFPWVVNRWNFWQPLTHELRRSRVFFKTLRFPFFLLWSNQMVTDLSCSNFSYIVTIFRSLLFLKQQNISNWLITLYNPFLSPFRCLFLMKLWQKSFLLTHTNLTNCSLSAFPTGRTILLRESKTILLCSLISSDDHDAPFERHFVLAKVFVSLHRLVVRGRPLALASLCLWHGQVRIYRNFITANSHCLTVISLVFVKNPL